MTPKYADGEDCSIKFATTYERRERFIAACKKAELTQVEVLNAMIEAWSEEIEGGEFEQAG